MALCDSSDAISLKQSLFLLKSVSQIRRCQHKEVSDALLQYLQQML